MEAEAEAFLDVADEFRLGELETEKPHPLTGDLALWAQSDLTRAFDVLREVDCRALGILSERAESLQLLGDAIEATFDSGNRVFLCGCGATGRLSLSLELFCRAEGLVRPSQGKQVVAFMAGGDAALIRSIERFEDRPDYGERQLRELGFADGDLLIASTEAGETPFVIGATEAAAQISHRPPFFLYGNPDEILIRVVERSKRVLENDRIEKINLSTGPMALSGSTRMQASTVLMAAIGCAFGDGGAAPAVRARAASLIDWWSQVDLQALAKFTEYEAAIYSEGEYVLYEPGPFGITVLTDTTERSPTFALTPFENVDHLDERPSYCYLHLRGGADAGEAWRALLQREPRALEWGELRHLTGSEAILGFDFSDGVTEHRRRRTDGARHHSFRIEEVEDGVHWRLGELEVIFSMTGLDRFSKHLALKMMLNAHSTLVMGRLGRYERNVMTHVNASNHKLIDRAVRYTQELLQARGAAVPPYEDLVRSLFEERDNLAPDEAIVLRLVERFLKREAPDSFSNDQS